MENLNIRRRNKLRHHFTTTSNVLLFGYPKLSDGAKVTYQVIDSFDWADSAGLRKGFAYPSLGRLAKIRGVDERTIRRHLVELEKAMLITRQERPGRPNLLIIEDASELETLKYLRDFAGGVGEDKNVRPTPDKNVRPILKKHKERKKQTFVNDEDSLSKGSERDSSAPEHIGHTLTVVDRQLRRQHPAAGKARREYLAGEMLSVLRDEWSLGYYRRLAEQVEPSRIFEALSTVKQLAREGRVHKSRGAAFVSLMRKATGRHSEKPAPVG